MVVSIYRYVGMAMICNALVITSPLRRAPISNSDFSCLGGLALAEVGREKMKHVFPPFFDVRLAISLVFLVWRVESRRYKYRLQSTG
jgi:cystathionine beta-lyase family protein involved in aluminum resistance